MVEITTGDSAIRITSRSDDSLVVGVDGWRADETVADPEETVPIDAVVSGHLTRLRGQTEAPMIASPDVDLADHLGEKSVRAPAGHSIVEPVSLPEAAYRVTFQRESLILYARFEAAVSMTKRPDDTWLLDFPHPTPVSFAVRDTSDRPRGVVTAASTPEGVAEALSTLSAGLRTTTPDRSFPSLRHHPPRIELGDSTAVPGSVRERVPETGIELCVPGRIGALLSVAPLAHYLCASVTVGHDRPVLRAPAVGLEHTLPPAPGLSTAASELLERVFWLDCLARNGGPHGVDLVDVEQAREAGLDPDLDALYDASPAERLRRYLELDFGAVADVFPRWQTAAVVEPAIENVTAVPRLAFELAKIYTPESGAVSDRSVGDGSVPPTEPPSTGPGGARVGCRVTPELSPDPLATTPDALQRFERDDDGGPVRVVVIDAPGDAAVDSLVDRAELADAGVRIERHSAPTRSAVRAALAEPPAVLYHTAAGPTPGIECDDGPLEAAELPTPLADIAVLDTPDSVSVARELVGGNKAAAAVARCRDRGEGRVGVDPVRWLLQRVRVGDALWLSRRYGETGTAATVVGDVFRQLRLPTRQFPTYYWCRPDGAGDGDGALLSLQQQGGHQTLHTTRGEGQIGLGGTPLTVQSHSLRGTREDTVTSVDPVIYDGRVYWREERMQLLNPLV